MEQGARTGCTAAWVGAKYELAEEMWVTAWLRQCTDLAIDLSSDRRHATCGQGDVVRQW
jgi:hypothetical protein